MIRSLSWLLVVIRRSTIVALSSGRAFEVHVWSDTGIHIFQEAIPKSSPSREDDATIATVLHTVELALGEAASEKLGVNRAWPLRPKELL
jgi:hypothetical protein